MEPPNNESKKSWDAPIPIGRGFVNISDAEVYGLMPGISTASGVDRYAVAMFHQHCLVSHSLDLQKGRADRQSALRDKYSLLMDAMSEDWTDAARQEERDSRLRWHAQPALLYVHCREHLVLWRFDNQVGKSLERWS